MPVEPKPGQAVAVGGDRYPAEGDWYLQMYCMVLSVKVKVGIFRGFFSRSYRATARGRSTITFGMLSSVMCLSFCLRYSAETRDYPQQGQQGADPKDEFDAGLVGQPAEEGRAEAAEAEHQPEKDPGDHPDLAGHQVGGVDQDGGECRGDDESDDDGEHDRAGQVRIGQQQGEGRSPEDGAPDHVFTPETVAQRPAGDRADSRCPEECEEAVLRPCTEISNLSIRKNVK